MKILFNFFRLPRHFTSRNDREGYTLAEVIIAVAIIGTLATLTISTYMTGSPSQNNQYVAGLKKAYAQLSYATDQLKAKNSGTMIGSWNSSGSSNGADAFRNLYSSYLKFNKTCDAGAGGNCWHTAGTIKYLWGDTDTSGYGWNSKAILNDGTLILFAGQTTSACDYTYFGTSNICAQIIVDVNGFKGPNQWGRDIHFFWVNKNSISPQTYTNGGSVNCNSSGNGEGQGCAYRVLKEGKMMY